MISAEAGAPQARAAGATRPPELEAWLNRWIFHPLANRLAAALAPTPVTPNAVSVAGALVVAAAAFFYTGLDWPLSVLLGFAAHSLWHVLDGADGALARLTGKSSPSGEMVDGACDYAGHGILYVALAAFLDDSLGGWAWALATFSAFSRAVQSNHSESQRRTYLWRVYGIPWIRQAHQSRDEMFRRPGFFMRLGAILVRAYVGVAAAVGPLSGKVDGLVERAKETPSGRLLAERLCKRAGRRSLPIQGWLGSNPRTMLLGLSMAAGTPLWFFIVETTLLNLLLLLSILNQKRCDAWLAASLSAARSE